MKNPICIEDKIAEKLKDICDHRATYLVRFSYGDVRVEEIHDISNKQDSKHPTIFDIQDGDNHGSQ